MFEKIKENLLALGYEVSVFENKETAAEYLNGRIDQTTVGIGGSVTVQEMGLFDLLDSHNRVYWHMGVADREEAQAQREGAAAAEVYLTSVNGAAETGELINIDGNGNRVAGTYYGHKKVYLILGKNKIAPDYDAALWRARNIASPKNAKRLGAKTPCAVKGDRCYDCKSPGRICRGLSVFWAKPFSCDMEVILINEDLGY
ncbi:MAG: lactate utilization protein [Eubacteriales bacterium]|nr:lactate utilization protein [Eubacteriales bacterium]